MIIKRRKHNSTYYIEHAHDIVCANRYLKKNYAFETKTKKNKNKN